MKVTEIDKPKIYALLSFVERSMGSGGDKFVETSSFEFKRNGEHHKILACGREILCFRKGPDKSFDVSGPGLKGKLSYIVCAIEELCEKTKAPDCPARSLE